MNTFINCSVCKKPLAGRQKLFCSSKCKNSIHQSYDAQKGRALERKLYFINSLGGSCSRCGYRENLAALSFHHRSGKEYKLDSRSLSNRGIDDMTKEVAKCDLLCGNCHMELHHPHLDLVKLSIEPTALTTELQARMPRGRDARHDANLIIAENVAFEKKFAENLRHCGVQPGQTIILGVSGGVDSVTMLDLFAKTAMKLNIVVAHMNHGVRKEAVKDELLVKKLAAKHGFGFVSKTIAKPKSGNLEDSLRNERRKFLLDVSKKSDTFALVALAHHADDQAETFIMHAVRGSGSAGLGSMDMKEDGIIRPLLNLARKDIETYARANNLIWHDDVTNQDMSYDRNYIRHRILPLLTRLNHDYLSAIHRTTYLQRRIDEHLKEEALHVIARSQGDAAISSVIDDGDCFVPRNDVDGLVSTKHLRRLDKPLLYEVLGLLYEEAKGDRENLSLGHLQNIESLISSDEGTRTLDLPDGITVRRSYDKLDFYSKKAHNTPSTPSAKKLRTGQQMYGSWKVTISPSRHPEPSEGSRTPILDSSVHPRNDEERRTNSTIDIDADLLPRLTLRTRKPGDVIQSIGMRGRKKLQDLFVDAKIVRTLRDVWPVLVDTASDQIIWVPGLAKAKVETNSKKILTINIVEVISETIETK